MQVTTADHVERMRQALESLCDDVGAYLHESSLFPLSGSIAAKEMADHKLAEQIATAYDQGNLLLESAADHAFALTRLLVEPVATVAPWTCARGGLEASAVGCWLLSRCIDSRERVSRSFAHRYDGLREQTKLAGATGDEEVRRSLTERIEEVDQQAIALEYAPVLNRDGKRIGIGQVMPAKTRCIEDTFRLETLYRIFSGMAHSQSSSLVQLGFLAEDPDAPMLMKKAMTANAAVVLLVTAADTLARPTWAKAELYGLNLARLAAILQRRYDEMGIDSTRYFWRDEGPS